MYWEQKRKDQPLNEKSNFGDNPTLDNSNPIWDNDTSVQSRYETMEKGPEKTFRKSQFRINFRFREYREEEYNDTDYDLNLDIEIEKNKIVLSFKKSPEEESNIKKILKWVKKNAIPIINFLWFLYKLYQLIEFLCQLILRILGGN